MSIPTTWEGVDKTVIEKTATDAGHPARDPYINTDQGDLLLFMFLLAGAIGGFIVGYTFRGLFPPRKKAPAQPDQTAWHP
jgi:cobalt/nickel transport system permease protein/cobalt/nickel transport protein